MPIFNRAAWHPKAPDDCARAGFSSRFFQEETISTALAVANVAMLICHSLARNPVSSVKRVGLLCATGSIRSLSRMPGAAHPVGIAPRAAGAAKSGHTWARADGALNN